MSKSIKVPASEGLLEDVKRLRELLDAASAAEAVRRAIARELLLLEALQNASTIEIKGKNENGERVMVLM